MGNFFISMERITDTSRTARLLDKTSFQLQNTSFHIVTTTNYKFSPAMNKNLYGKLISGLLQKECPLIILV